MFEYDITSTEFLRPIVSGWTSKIEMAQKARKSWQEQASECRMFYNRSAAAMWDPAYTKKFWSGVEAPRFRITMNLAYEYVAVFAPNLLWEVPHREVKPKRGPAFPEEMLGELHEHYQAEIADRDRRDTIVAFFLKDWLNYTALEQPGGGLIRHSEFATIDALLTGRGVQWVRPYHMPGSNRVLTGCFWEPPEKLLIDPDFRSIHDAKWISLEHTDPHWVVERRFKQPEGSLKGKASLESSWSYGESAGNPNSIMHRRAGQTNDLVVWYEVWSKTGVGGRLTGMDEKIRDNLERVVGDYAYIAFSPGVPYPLNCSAEDLRRGATPDDVKRKFSWPVPVWADGRWPAEVLDFYPNTDHEDESAAWPIAPLAPAMGEIKFLNFIIPWLTNRIWNTTRDFWAIAGPHYDEFLRYLQEGKDQTVIPVPAIVDDVRKAVQIIQQPETRADMWKIVEVVTDIFRKRVGLPEYAYGMSTTQSRTAEDARGKLEAIGARPQYMQKKLVAYQGELAALEAFVTRWFVTSKDVVDRYGQIGGMLWDQHIVQPSVELVVRQMQYSIAASSIRRPNRDRDIENLQSAQQYWLAIIQQYGEQTGDYSPANGLLEVWGELHDMDMSKLYIPPPQEDQQQAQIEQQAQQLELQKLQVDIQKSQADIEKAKIELQGKMLDAQIKQQMGGVDIQQKQLEFDFAARQGEQQLVQDQQKHVLEILQGREKFAQDLSQQKQMAKVKQKAVATNGSKSNGSKK